MPKVNKLTTGERQEDRIRKTLKHGLAEKEWTTKHLAELCGIDGAQVSRIINHPMQRRFGDVIKVAKTLGIESLPT